MQMCSCRKPYLSLGMYKQICRVTRQDVDLVMGSRIFVELSCTFAAFANLANWPPGILFQFRAGKEIVVVGGGGVGRVGGNAISLNGFEATKGVQGCLHLGCSHCKVHLGDKRGETKIPKMYRVTQKGFRPGMDRVRFQEFPLLP